MSYNTWISSVDHIFTGIIGLSIHDIEDMDYFGMYEDGFTPDETVQEILERIGM